MRIQHNIMAMNAYRNYMGNTSALSKNLEKLSSGYKINRAGDDAAGLAISEKMRAQITGLDAAQKNVADGISLVKTAEGAMQEVHDMLNRMVYLATQSANGTYDNEVDRANLQKEIESLSDEINRIADSANFNGIKLMNGDLATNADSAISNITTSEFSAGGASEAFEATYITNRPEAATTQKNAKFEVSFDDINVAAASKSATNGLVVNIGDASVTVLVPAGTKSDALTGGDIAKQFVQSGFKITSASSAVAYNDADPTTVSDKMATSAWDAGTTDPTTIPNDANKYFKIDGNWYEAAANGNTVTFTQVNHTGNGGEVVNPDFNVSVSKLTSAGAGEVTGTVNWQVQSPTTGTGVGSSHQAQVEVDIDFSKLKDGDTLTVGDKQYVFELDGKDVPGSVTTGAPTLDTTNGQVLIDLSDIFKTEADFADADKQAEAMAKITKAMDTSLAWSAGNGGVSNGVGTLTFQSLSSHQDDSTTSATPTTAGTVAAYGSSELTKMDTEANIMKQFYGNSKLAAASTSFDVDVIKIKAGDTFSVGDVTFEFTDGARTNDADNVAIDLSSVGIAGKITPDKQEAVLDAVKSAIEGQLGTNYTVTVDGNKVTLESNDLGTTANVDERRVAANVTGGGAGLTLQIGDTADEYNKLKVSIGDMHTTSLGIGDISIADQASAAVAVDKIRAAINSVSATRGDLGAIQNRLEHTANNLSVMEENIQDAESNIRDTDIAEEMMAYTKNNILIQSAQAMLAQANQVPQGVLQLLQ